MRSHRGALSACVLAVCLVVCLVGAPAPALATAPDIDKQPGGTDSRTSLDTCAFPVRQDVQFQQSMVKVFQTRDGGTELRLSAAYTGTVTHVLPDGSDGPSVRVNFSGPGVIDGETGGITARGPWLLESEDDPTTTQADGFLLLTRGLVEVSVDPVTAALTIDSSRGSITDLCAALA